MEVRSVSAVAVPAQDSEYDVRAESLHEGLPDEPQTEDGLPQDVVLEVPLLRQARPRRATAPPPAAARDAEPAEAAEDPALLEPRFRIIIQKPMRPAPLRRNSQVRNVTLLAAIPACFLISYVFFVTAAVKGGYYKSALTRQLEELRVEQADLEADLRRLQAPSVIFSRAEKLGMRTAQDRRYVEVPREGGERAEGGERL
jgi:hypothetical protein